MDCFGLETANKSDYEALGRYTCAVEILNKSCVWISTPVVHPSGLRSNFFMAGFSNVK